MESFKNLIAIKNDLSELPYKNRSSLTYVRRSVEEAIQYIRILQELTIGFNVEDEIILLYKDLKLINERSSPRDGFNDCMADLIGDLERIIDIYSMFA